MRFLTWNCDSGKASPNSLGLLLAVLGLLAGVGLVPPAATPSASGWQITPVLRLSGGDESNLVIDPEVSRIVIPGGLFVELAPAVSARRWIGRRTLIDLGTFATLQRFFNDRSRLLYAHTVQAGAFRDFGSGFRARLSGTFDYLDDSELETVRRLGMGGELGVAFMQPQWNLEIWGGRDTRGYLNLTLQEWPGQTSTYREGTWGGGTILRVFPSQDIGLRVDGVFQGTDSRDPLFDSDSWALRASIDARPLSSLLLTISGAYQERAFDRRIPGQNQDEYWQIGAGLRHDINPTWAASVRWGYSEYTWPDGNEENSRRLAVGIHCTWGRSSVPPSTEVDVDALTRASGGSVQRPDSDGRVCLRARAPGAERVTVAGNFNAWDAEATPLRSAGDGWWETCVKLAPGVYEYAYVIDGAWVTPPEAKLTVGDGFGALNGILEVLPADL